MCYNLNMIFYFCFSSIASKIKDKVASVPFEQFHKHSAVFRKDANGTVCTKVVFSAHNLVSFILVMIKILYTHQTHSNLIHILNSMISLQAI